MLMKTRAKIKNQLLLGAHTSAQGGAYRALLEGKEIGATTIQLFTANQKQWKAKPLTEEAIALFEQTLQETGLEQITSHAGYLINLGGPNPDNLHKSREAMAHEIERCLALQISYLNFHPGAALTDPIDVCLDRIVQSMLAYQDYFTDDSLRLLLETTAGQGSCVGCRFEELAYIIEHTEKKLPVGVCLDTCHVFAAGYDIRTEAALRETLQEFDRIIGLQHLHALHLNDSIHDLGSRKDRHAALGEGKIGLDAFKCLVTSPLTRHLPMYLETPGGPPLWDKEIGMLQSFAQGK